MLLKTRLFDEIKFNADEIINFTKPILGFEDCKQYILAEKETMFPTFWLQCVDKPDIAFPVVSPFFVHDGYSIKLQTQDLDDIRLKNSNEVIVFSLMVVSQTFLSIRANLRAPIIYNPRENVAKQLILTDDKFPIHYYLI
ncbi:MAG: flagellar assembly protein FliW [Candidatus Loosdrechtia sp.]|uniref:flagellar assembly protein FliW n=1 Tax=Candidatus Loosdrechtia sp. TaxID=3101272 RepID=UPI003A787AD8|nr:MAG: flagellar assembly protein FliW [Candidatus Jettenia sp. AMX2]